MSRAAVAAQARAWGWQVVRTDPPRRSSRFLWYEGTLHSVRPDAFGVLNRDGEDWPYFPKWERRAVRPTPMSARIVP